MSRIEELISGFRERGYKMTPQRRAILTALVEDMSHPTAEQLYSVVKVSMPDISLATVYNTLRELAYMDEVDELEVGHEGRHYEVSREKHAHRVCLECGKIEDVTGDCARVRELFPADNGFCVERCDITFYGYCLECNAARDAEC